MRAHIRASRSVSVFSISAETFHNFLHCQIHNIYLRAWDKRSIRSIRAESENLLFVCAPESKNAIRLKWIYENFARKGFRNDETLALDARTYESANVHISSNGFLFCARFFFFFSSICCGIRAALLLRLLLLLPLSSHKCEFWQMPNRKDVETKSGNLIGSRSEGSEKTYTIPVRTQSADSGASARLHHGIMDGKPRSLSIFTFPAWRT